MSNYYIWNPYSNFHLDSNKIFSFSGAKTRVKWPKHGGTFLGAAGTYNFLLRVGIKPTILSQKELSIITKGDIVFILLEDFLPSKKSITQIRELISKNTQIIASGSPKAWILTLPELFCGKNNSCENPYAGLAYHFPDKTPEIIAPPQWEFFTFETVPNVDFKKEGHLMAIQGERQTPLRALLIEQKNAPAIICYKNTIFLNGSPFHSFQSWLQGQEDINPWLNWRHRLFWLDQMVAYIQKLLLKYVFFHKQKQAKLLPELGNTCVILRHDLDFSQDTRYLEAEEFSGFQGVHAVLKDANTNFWVKKLKQFPKHEMAFHYNTGKYSRSYNWLRRKIGKPALGFKPARKDILGKGLNNQVQWAKKKGVCVSTIHRHLPFILYPEYIDALDYLFKNDSSILGASSMFRANILRWGADRVNGRDGTYSEFPDVQFPYWFPYKLAHAGKAGKILRGWESASMMEVEPELLLQMLEYKVEGLNQQIITINFHPAHIQSSTFYREGSLKSFKQILNLLSERDINVLTLKHIYQYLNKEIKE